MICKHCKVKMREQKRSFHKRRKWICPVCGKASMQNIHLKKSERVKGLPA